MARHLPPLKALRAVEAVARHLSISRAAEELHVTPAAVSQQVKALEDLLGVPLFRRGRSLAIAEPLAAALPHLRDGFDALERAAEHLRAGAQAGPLLVTAPPAFAARWLIPRLERFQDDHPEVEIRLTATIRVVDLEAEDADVALRYGSGHYPGLVVDRLLDEEVLPVCTAELAASVAQPADLLSQPLLHDDNVVWDVSFPDWPSWLRAHGVDLPPGTELKGRHFGDSSLILEAAARGLGVALVRRSLVAEDLAAGRLVRLFGFSHPIAYGYHFVCLPRRLHSPKVSAFRAWLLAEAAAYKDSSC